MRRLFTLGLLIALASMSLGCATCCNPYDYAYGYHGGAWQRDDLCNGRVGSVYAPAGSRVHAEKQSSPSAEAAEPNPLPPESAPEVKPETKPDDLNTSRPLKSVKRTRQAPRHYLPDDE